MNDVEASQGPTKAVTGPRALRDPRSREYAIQTMQSLKRFLESEAFDARHVGEELQLIIQHRHWEVCGFENPDAYVRAEAGTTLKQLERAVDGRRAARRIDSIVVGARHRHDLGDIVGLAMSIDQNGLLHPVVVTPDGRLIAGERRLEAYKLLGRTEIPVTEVDLEEIARGELAENADRKDFLPSEIEAIRRTLEPVERAAAKARMSEGGKGRKVSGPSDARDRIGAFAGVSGRTIEKIAAVVAAAEAEPEKYGKLAEAMDRNGRVNGPYLRLVNMRSAAAIRAEPPPLPDGKWRVANADVPWPSEPDDPEPAERGYWNFATMSIEALCGRLDIAARLHDDSVLWFWTTNFHMRYAYTILDAWGFRLTPTILTWGKDQPGRGQRLLGQTEHCIMAIRGNPVITLTNQSTLLLAPIPKPRTLARKPAEAYALIESLCPAPAYLDVFSRYRHNEKWTCWGAEAPALTMSGEQALDDDSPLAAAEAQE